LLRIAALPFTSSRCSLIGAHRTRPDFSFRMRRMATDRPVILVFIDDIACHVKALLLFATAAPQKNERKRTR
jgi:hypothetical protein